MRCTLLTPAGPDCLFSKLPLSPQYCLRLLPPHMACLSLVGEPLITESVQPHLALHLFAPRCEFWVGCGQGSPEDLKVKDGI